MDTQVADNLIGTLVDGRYRVRGRVARGGMATVYTAIDERLERTVALKMIHPGQAGEQHFVERFNDEAKTIARLTHPNVVAVYDQGTHHGLPYLVMEFVRGRTLRDILADNGRMDALDALAVLEQMLAAVAAAHRAGLVHRDVKPENVLVADSPGSSSLADAVVKVADFGLARAVEASADDGDGQLLATVAYVAPELVTEGRADPRSDVYSIGIVLFEMVTGRVPYDGGRPIDVAWRHVDEDVPRPSRIVPDLPPEIDSLVIQATARQPYRRATDAGVMLTSVQRARESIEATSSLRGRTMSQPTIEVGALRAVTGAVDRPAWSRLPRDRSTATHDRTATNRSRTSSLRDRAGSLHGRSGGATAGARGRGFGGGGRPTSPAAEWFAAFMSRPNGRRTFYATLAVLALIVAITGWWFGFGRYTSAPSLVGQTQAAATTLAEEKGLHITVGAPVFDAHAPQGTVVRQVPGPNAKIVSGGTVELILSKGPEQYKIPDESGRLFTVAQQDLVRIKADVKETQAYDNDLDTGYVIKTDPKAGTVIKPGTVVTVTVSKGRAPITVPNVITLPYDQANQQLTGMGLVVAETQKASDKPAGTVIDQSLPENSGATKGQTIVLTVSTGPPMVTVPNVSNVGYTFQQAQQILQQAGLNAADISDLGGQVRQQDPPQGTQEPEGFTVNLWVSP